MSFFKKLFSRKPKQGFDSVEINKKLAQKVEVLKRPAVRLRTTTEITKSKFGGSPFASKQNFEWPRSNGKPMTFLAQLDLSEISEVHQYDWLGDEGLLLFFYDVIEMPWGFDPKDRGKWSVLYQREPDTIFNYPDGEDEYEIDELYIRPELVNILPGYDDPSVGDLGLSEDEIDDYFDLNQELGPDHQVGGFPSVVQNNNMEEESQLASNGIYLGDGKGYRSEEAKKLKLGVADWKLLFQFDSDDELNVMWGDCGTIYFWVQEQKSKKNEFDNTWLVLQCS